VGFTSPTFVVFLAVFFTAWPLVRAFAPRAVAHVLIVAASLVFYGWSDWRFVVLLAAIALVGFGFALRIALATRRATWLTASLVLQLGVLAAFKYLDFLLGREPDQPVLGIALPIGLSFYVLQSVSYTIDVYRRRADPTTSLLIFIAYLALFPRITAGPIVRARQLIPQLETLPRPTEDIRWRGTKLIAFGLFKKMAVADRLAGVVNFYYEPFYLVDSTSALLWWFVSVAYVFQLYCDISGYTDIARGVALWMGIDLPDNFHRPFQARSLREFWARWHITLTSWFRDYVWFPIARRWRSPLGFHVATFVAFVLYGLWHGPRITFITFAAINALLYSLERVTRWDRRLSALPGGRIVASLIVFLTVTVTLVVFRAGSLEQAQTILSTMFSTDSIEHNFIAPIDPDPGYWIVPAIFVASHVLIVFGVDRWPPIVALGRSPWTRRLAPIAVALLLLLAIGGRANWPPPLIYGGF
jgi:alginate O-acetyltransferase complex protein AlgI